MIRVMLLGLAVLSTTVQAKEEEFLTKVRARGDTERDEAYVTVKPFCKFGYQFLTTIQTRRAEGGNGGIETIQVFEKISDSTGRLMSAPMPCREEK